MATFLLRWNPAISSVKDSDFKRMRERYPFVALNWSIWDYRQAMRGKAHRHFKEMGEPYFAF